MSKELKLGVYALCVAVFEANQNCEAKTSCVPYSRFKQVLRTKTSTSQVLINYIGEKEAINLLSNPANLSRQMSENELITYSEESTEIALTEKGLELAKEFEKAFEAAEDALESESARQVLELLAANGIETNTVARTTQLNRGEFAPTFYHPQFYMIASLKGERIVFVHGIGAYKLDNVQEIHYPEISKLQNSLS